MICPTSPTTRLPRVANPPAWPASTSGLAGSRRLASAAGIAAAVIVTRVSDDRDGEDRDLSGQIEQFLLGRGELREIVFRARGALADHLVDYRFKHRAIAPDLGHILDKVCGLDQCPVKIGVGMLGENPVARGGLGQRRDLALIDQCAAVGSGRDRRDPGAASIWS